MIRRRLILCWVLICLVVTSCGGKVVHRPGAIQDAEGFTQAGLQAFSEANWKNAQLLFNRALSLYQGMDDLQGALHSHINLAEVALSRRDNSTAQTHLDYAANLAKKTPFQHYQRRITLLYAQHALQQTNIKQAATFLQKLLPEFNGVDPIFSPDSIQVAAIANRTKVAFIQQRDEANWTLKYSSALKISAIESPLLNARLLRFQAILLQRKDKNVDAESLLQQALSLYKTSLSRFGIAATLSELGVFYVSQKQWQKASDFLNRSNTVYRYLGDVDKVAQNTESLVIVEKELGNQGRSNILNP